MLDEDPRTALLYEAAIRTLDQQALTVESVRVRASVLLSAAAIATSFLAGIVLDANKPQLDTLGWVAVGCFVLIVGLCLAILWPTREWKFRSNVKKLARDYVDSDPPATSSEMHRDLALHMENWAEVNAWKMRWLFYYFQAASILLGVEVVAWIADLWRR